jgi:hypothetical protein
MNCGLYYPGLESRQVNSFFSSSKRPDRLWGILGLLFDGHLPRE